MKRAPGYRPKCRTCERSRRSTDLMCRRCWALVSTDIQQEVNRTVVRGSIRQSEAWTAAVEQAVAEVKVHFEAMQNPQEGNTDMTTQTLNTPAPPPTPNCDRLDDGYNAVGAFLEFLAEQGLVIVPHADLHKVVSKAAQAQVLLALGAGARTYTEIEQKLEADRVASEITVGRPDPQKLLDELYGVDQRELERERRALLRYNNQLHHRGGQ